MKRTAACWACAVLAWSAADASELPRHIAGRVLDEASGAPVADARVALVGADIHVTSDAQGCFTLQPPAAGRWRVQVSAVGFSAALVDADASANPGASATVSPCGATADVDVVLHGTSLRVSEHVVVTPGRRDEREAGSPRAVSVVDRSDLEAHAPRTTPEALADAAGVFVQKTSHGSGAPYVRGLIGNHVLLLIDGIRVNNATYRYGPHQYLATVDPHLLERIEVVRGPGSVMFGSDAIGGVVNLITRQPALSPEGTRVDAGVDTTLVSSGMEHGGRLVASVRAPRVAVQAGITLQSFGDLVAGGHLGVERPSGYDHAATDASLLVQLAPRHLVSIGYQFDRQDDVLRWDQVVQRGYEQYAFAPQQRQLAHARWRFAGAGDLLRTVAVTASLQHTREGRDIVRRGAPVSTMEEDTVRTLGVSTAATGRFATGWEWTMGSEWYHDRVGSRRDDTTIATGAGVRRRGLYPEGATASSAAAFVRTSVSRGPWHAEGGARATRVDVDASDQLFADVSVNRTAVVADAGGAFDVTPRVQIIGHVAQSFRAPNIDDLSSLGRFDFGVEVPAPGLEPERGVTIEGGMRVSGRRVAGRLTGYRTGLHDLIDRVRATYEGATTWEGQDVYQKANVGNAVVRGVEAEGEWRPWSSVSFVAHATYTHGHNATRDEPMRRIPPLNGMVRVAHQGHAWWMHGTLRWASRQDRLSSGDIDDHRIADDGTPGWATLDLSAGRTFGSRLTLRGGLANAFDAAYRTHGSGMDGAGRSVWVALGVTLPR